MFRSGDDYPSIKRGFGKRRKRGNSRSRNRSLEKLPSLNDYRGKRRPQRNGLPIAEMVVIGLCLAIVGVAVAGPGLLPTVGSIIPSRYILAYAPEDLQPTLLGIDPNAQVATPVGYVAGEAEVLLADAATPTPAPQPTATAPPPVQGPSTSNEGGGYLQPTSVAVAPTVTVTPASALPVDPNAVDRQNSSDLSNVDNLLTGFDWEQQGYNNCGPASLKTLMSYWGIKFSEEQAAAYLKPNPSDPNVRPDEMAAYAAQYDYDTVVRVNGSRELLQDFITAGYPIMIETGYDPEPETVGWTSHYLTLVGFTDDGFIAMDTYRRPNWFYAYEEIELYWRQFNRKYLVFHRADQRAAVESIILNDMQRSEYPEVSLDEDIMWEQARLRAQSEVLVNRSDPFAWYNLGASLTGLGRYDEAVSAFNEARTRFLPERFPWYQFEMYEAYLQAGQFDDVITIAEDVLQRVQTEEAHYYLGLAYAAQGNMNDARRELNRAVAFNPNYEAAQLALDALGEE